MLGRKMEPINIHLLPDMFLPKLLKPCEMRKGTGRAQRLLSHTYRNIRTSTPRHYPCKHNQCEQSPARSPQE